MTDAPPYPTHWMDPIYRGGQHAACEHYARVGYGHLIEHGGIDLSGQPGDDAEDDDPGCRQRWLDSAVVALLVGDLTDAKVPTTVRPPKPKKDGTPKESKSGPATEPGEYEPRHHLAGVWLTWHNFLPELSVWAGRATLATLVGGRRYAVGQAGYDPRRDGRPWDWSIPYPTSSGLDCRSVANALDAGFSPATLGMSVHCFLAAELLCCVGLEVSPVTRFGRKEYGYQGPDGRWWRYTIDDRDGWGRTLGMARPQRAPATYY